MKSGQDDNDLVTGVSGFANQSSVITRLSGLNMSDDEATPIPRPVARGVFQ